MATVLQSSSAGPSNSKTPQTFEFTKRKRFADLLITELAEAIVLVLSSECKVLFCGTAVTELLGWRDEDLVDGDLIGLINEEDRSNFRSSFADSLQTRNELLCYVRLKCKSHFSPTADFDPNPKEVLFEFKGHPHFVADDLNCKCYFAVAKPYPSRNTAMLNTFLELKMENERLQQRVTDLRKRVPKTSSIPSSSSLPNVYGSSSMPPPRAAYPAPLTIPSRRAGDTQQSYYPMSASSVGSHGYGGMMPSPASASFDSGNLTPYGAMYGTTPVDDEVTDDGSRKKKIKKSHTSEQYVCVTCGRTDSPEWRKGPQGPKTLCNACGLRWAKQQRKTDDGTEGSGDSQAQGTHS